jgi:single-strand DNA-binding protein|nr:MAG TPA: Single strand binding protein [Caudoviricetes sp.]
MLNVVALMGRLVADPELKTTQSGNSVCTFRVAVDRSYVSQGEERQADFITVTAWRKTAEFVSKYFQKGSMISVHGRLETRQYQDKNGNNRTATEVLAAEVGFFGPKAAEKPATASYEKQTANHVREANAPQQPQSYAQGSVDDFAEISDADDLPF